MIVPGQPARVIALVHVAYRPDEPTWLARSIAALAEGLRQLGHRPVIITATPQRTADPDIIALRQLPLAFPCDHDRLRQAVSAHSSAIAAELTGILRQHKADAVVYADPLLGLGRLAGRVAHPARRVMIVRTLDRREGAEAAIATADLVLAPWPSLIARARDAGYDTRRWAVLTSPLLVDPRDVRVPSAAEREQLRQSGRVRAVARLDLDNGITTLLRTAAPGGPPLELALAPASVEPRPGGDQDLLECCHSLAIRSQAQIVSPLRWHDVPFFLAGAAITVVPARASSRPLGMVAIESLSVGTPVISHRAGCLPQVLGDDTAAPAGILAPARGGPAGVWLAVRQLLADPDRYHALSRTARRRSRRYSAARVVARLLDALW